MQKIHFITSSYTDTISVKHQSGEPYESVNTVRPFDLLFNKAYINLPLSRSDSNPSKLIFPFRAMPFISIKVTGEVTREGGSIELNFAKKIYNKFEFLYEQRWQFEYADHLKYLEKAS